MRSPLVEALGPPLQYAGQHSARCLETREAAALGCESIALEAGSTVHTWYTPYQGVARAGPAKASYYKCLLTTGERSERSHWAGTDGGGAYEMLLLGAGLVD